MILPMLQYEGFNITFQITEDCNLRCRYCYEVNKRPRNLPFEYAQRFIDLILSDSDPVLVQGTDMEWILKKGLIMDFIGGDALMLPHLCDKILQYFQFQATLENHRWATRWRCSISTNGTLFDYPSVKEFLLKYKKNISLGISVDGCPEIHNRNRSNSMDIILKNWDWYLNYMGEYANTKATLNKDSIPYIADSIKFLHSSLQLRYINMNFIFEDMQLEEEDYLILEEEFRKSIEYIYEHKDDLHVNMFSKEFGVGQPMNAPDKSWCGAGAMPCLSVNGKIYPCFRFTPSTMNSDDLDLYVGDIWNGFNHKERFVEVREQTREKISPKECFDCKTETTCSWCAGGAYSTGKGFHRPLHNCRIRHLIDKYSKLYWRMIEA